VILGAQLPAPAFSLRCLYLCGNAVPLGGSIFRLLERRVEGQTGFQHPRTDLVRPAEGDIEGIRSGGRTSIPAPSLMPACHLEPKDKKAFIGAVGEELVRRHGKRKFYEPSAIRRAAESCGFPIDIHCWAYCIFSTPEDFQAIHDAAGEVCDYAAMKAEVLADLAGDGVFSPFDLDLSWLEWPDIDLSSIFDWFDISA
jgi:hypothetical protein